MSELAIDPSYQYFALALGLGLLVGLQRERRGSRLAGVRTFPLVTILGTLTGTLAEALGNGMVYWALGSLAVLIAIADVTDLRVRGKEADPGMTTEVALLVMFGVGVLTSQGSLALAAVIGGTTAVLLYVKDQLHGFAARLGPRDARAIMQFVVVTLVVLPILPNRTFGPYDVLNPRQIWWMVVLIVSLSLAGYVATRLSGERTGSLLGGALGGLISSTATTVSFARRSAGSSAAVPLAAIAILIASAVMMLRVLIEVAVVAPQQFLEMAWPIAISGGVLALLGMITWRRTRDEAIEVAEPRNPAELGSALIFGGLYALVIFLIAAMQDRFGSSGLYAVAAFSGLTDMDAITLSSAQMVRADRLDPSTAWRLVLVAASANMLFKGAIVALLGSRQLTARIAGLFTVFVIGNALLLWLW